MTLLWDRRSTVTVGTIQIQSRGLADQGPGDLRFSFDVTKTIRPEPNKCTLRLFNLNGDHRSYLQQLSPIGSTRGIPVQIEAGYAEGTSVIFLGDVRNAVSTKDGPDRITTLGGGDGEKVHQAARASQTFPKGTKPGDVVRALAVSLGVKPGNLNAAISQINTAFDGIFLGGTVITGRASDEMTRICKGLDLEWSIQNGVLQILDRKAALGKTAIVLNKDTGLLGNPTIGIDSKDKRQVVTCKSLLQPDVYPGRIVIVQSDDVQGQFRIEETHHQGDSRAETWEVEIKGKRY
jgi:hypothetical protein